MSNDELIPTTNAVGRAVLSALAGARYPLRTADATATRHSVEIRDSSLI
jgi:hypothetical protein